MGVMNILSISLGKHSGPNISFDLSLILAKTLLYNDFRLIYGGVDIGLLGVTANTELEQQGRLAGILPPQVLSARKIAEQKSLIMVKNESERARQIIRLAEAFVERPGGYGSHEDLHKLITRTRYGSTRQPLAFFTQDAFGRHIGRLLHQAADNGFIKSRHRFLIVLHRRSDALMCDLTKNAFSTPYQ